MAETQNISTDSTGLILYIIVSLGFVCISLLLGVFKSLSVQSEFAFLSLYLLCIQGQRLD